MLAVRLAGMRFRRDGPSSRGLIDAHLVPIPPGHRPDRGDGRRALRGRIARNRNPSGGTAAADAVSHPARRSWLPDARTLSRVSPGVLPPGLAHPPHHLPERTPFPRAAYCRSKRPVDRGGALRRPEVYRSAMTDRDETRTTRLAANAAAVAVVALRPPLLPDDPGPRRCARRCPSRSTRTTPSVSYAVMAIALVAGATWIRSLRHREPVLDPAVARRIRLGVGIALAIMGVTLVSDVARVPGAARRRGHGAAVVRRRAVARGGDRRQRGRRAPRPRRARRVGAAAAPRRRPSRTSSTTPWASATSWRRGSRRCARSGPW